MRAIFKVGHLSRDVRRHETLKDYSFGFVFVLQGPGEEIHVRLYGGGRRKNNKPLDYSYCRAQVKTNMYTLLPRKDLIVQRLKQDKFTKLKGYSDRLRRR